MKEFPDLKNMPSGFYIMIGMMTIAAAWAIQSMSGCAAVQAKYRAERDRDFWESASESSKAFWDSKK